MRGLEAFMSQMDYLSLEENLLIEKAYKFARECHKGQFRKSGDPYFTHCEEVASILASLYCDGTTIAAGLLHDTVEDCECITDDIIRQEFGPEVERIVDAVTKLKKKNSSDLTAYQDNNHQKIIRAMAKDYRVILVKLADRLHNMRTLEHMRPDKQKRISQETMQVYVPIASLLGLSVVKNELADIAFSYINPEEYAYLKNRIEMQRGDNKEKIQHTVDRIASLLPNYKVKCVYKPVFSYYKKSKKRALDELLNTQTVQVIVPNRSECYKVLEIIHTYFRALPNTFKDYYSTPKSNGYRALHTKIIDPESKFVYQIQILEEKVLDIAKYGIAAMTDQEQLLWYRDLKALVKEFNEGAAELMEALQTDLFPNKITVFSPEGDIYLLPEQSCVLDYAYSVHTDVGNWASKAMINGKMVPLNAPLKTGDIVYIQTSSKEMVCQDWLNFVQTKLARKKIRTALKENLEYSNHGNLAVVDIKSYNRAYLLSDIVTVLQQNNVSLHRADSKENAQHDRADTKIWMDLYSDYQMNDLKHELEKVRSVISVEMKWEL